MELLAKLQILADAAKYDVSCSSSGSSRKNKVKGLGNAYPAGICHSWADDGRCISLLKILFTNDCIYNCSYCINRKNADCPRATFTPDEVASLTINFYRRNYIEGLFLSSAVYKNANYTMELLLQTVRKLREEYNFNGYIHLKAIPGADFDLIAQAGTYVDRMSVNIELPSNAGLKLLAPQKTREAIIKPMEFIHYRIDEASQEKKKYKYAPSFVPAGQTTQLIIGATPEPDAHILRLSESLYRHFCLKRVYYSAYVPVSSDPRLPAIKQPPLLREHRLYQADWLLRFYGFSSQELLDEEHPNLDIELDPKSDWALRHLDLFPVEINKADYEMLIRVPGIGVRSAFRIVQARKHHSLDYESLKKFGVVLKRARHFITCKGKHFGESLTNEDKIRPHLISGNAGLNQQNKQGEQISFYSLYPDVFQSQEIRSVITGEL